MGVSGELTYFPVSVGTIPSGISSLTGRSRPEKAPPRAPVLPQDMVACSHCGVHVPRAEALMLGQHAYCCAEHRRQHSA